MSADLVREGVGTWRVLRAAEAPAVRVAVALTEDGQVLKASKRASTRRVGPCVVKRRALEGLRGRIEGALLRSRVRRPWMAARRLTDAGVRVPAPMAWAERRRGGVIRETALVMEFLEGWVSVEEHARLLIAMGAGQGEVVAFLRRIAHAVNALEQARVYHADLSGKNILTLDGYEIAFIDLEGIHPGRYTRRRRLKNHIQLYDSFCDYWGEDLLAPMIARMTPESLCRDRWLKEVQAGQAARRSRIEAIWRQKGGRP